MKTQIILLASIVLLCRHNIGCAQIQLPDVLSKALQACADSLQPCTLKWEVRNDALFTQKEVAKYVGFETNINDLEHTDKAKLSLDANNFHFVLDTINWSSAATDTNMVAANESHSKRSKENTATIEAYAVPARRDIAYNGNNLYVGDGGKINEDSPPSTLMIVPRDKIEMQVGLSRLVDSCYLEGIALSMPQQGRDFGRPLASTILQSVLVGARIISVNRNSNRAHEWLVKLETEQLQHEYRLDMLRAGMATAWLEKDKSGQLLRTCKNSEFTQYSQNSLWLPKKSEITYYYHPYKPLQVYSKPVYRQTISLVSVDFNSLPAKNFEIWYDEPGTNVGDMRPLIAREKEQLDYVVPANPDDLDEAILSAREGRPGPSTIVHRNYFRTILMSTTITAVVVLTILVVRRRLWG